LFILCVYSWHRLLETDMHLFFEVYILCTTSPMSCFTLKLEHFFQSIKWSCTE
jgi:hypothetical protein